MDLAIKAVVTSPSGFFYRQEHEWRNGSPAMATWIGAKLKEAEAKARAGSGKGGDRTATLSMTLDGVAAPDVVLTGITDHEQKKFQRMWNRLSDQVIDEHERQKK